MAEPLKHLLGGDVPQRIARNVRAAWPAFNTRAFLAQVNNGYEALELMPRGRRLAEALHTHLPADYAEAIEILVASMGPPMGLDAAGEPDAGDRDHSAFLYLPHSMFIATHGLGHFEASMRAQHALTQRFTAEFSIRPYLLQHEAATLKRLARWADDPNAHVRRLVSEGSRPRLPWATRLPSFIKDPRPVLPLLARLRDDPSSYVRRSVANHLNDIGKDHPALLTATAREWLLDAPDARQRLVRHALRFAIKRGDPEALAALGLGHAVKLDVLDARLTPARASIGGAITLSFALHNAERKAQQVLVDFRIHYVKANGGAQAKVFKLKTLTLAPGETQPISKRISLAQMTTRVHYPGRHQVDLLLNGQPHPLGAFTLKAET
jgi:3-methyladenine DNA glycosylase AlkC